MQASSFDEANVILGPPEGLTEDDVYSLNVNRTEFADGSHAVTSLWKLTQDELEEFQRTGRIWLVCLGGTMPPVIVTARKPEWL